MRFDIYKKFGIISINLKEYFTLKVDINKILEVWG